MALKQIELAIKYDNMAKDTEWITWIGLILLILVVVGIIIWLVFIQINLQNVQSSGTSWTITYGSTDQVSDQVPGGGGQLFVAQTKLRSGYIVQIQPSSSSQSGDNLWINNRSAVPITVTAATGVSINNQNLSSTIDAGGLAQYVYAQTDQLLRLT